MARGGNVRVKFDADTSDLQRGTRTAERDLDRLNRAGAKSLGALKTAAAGAGIAAGGGLVLGLTAAARAAAEAEKSQAKLNAQLKAIGKNSAATRKEIDAVVAAQSKMSGFDDEALTDSFTNIVRATGDVKRSLELNNLAMDIARAKNMDIAKAGELVGKVANGNVGILKRYGVTVKEGATVQEALAGAQRQFAGQAEAYGKTTAGAQDRARVAFENLGETVGKRIAPMLANALNSIAGALNSLIVAWPRLQATVTRVVGAVQSAISGFVAKNRSDINSFIGAVRNVGTVVRAVFEDIVLPVIRRLLPAIRQVFQGAITTIRGAVRVISGILTGDFGKAWDGVKDIFRGAIKTLGGIIRGATAPFRAAGAAIGGALINGIKSAFTGAGAIAASVGRAIRNWLNDNTLFGNKIDLGITSITIPKLARGGEVPGQGRGDKVPALLEPGEFVVRRKIVDKYGPTFFADMNAQRFADGGIVGRANKLERMRLPYLWGGGHGPPIPNPAGMDCSGAVSYVLGIPPRVSGQLASYGSSGPGPEGSTRIFANAKHVFMQIAGRFFGTSRENPGGGAGWHSARSGAGFTVRHVAGAAVTGSKGGQPPGREGARVVATKGTGVGHIPGIGAVGGTGSASGGGGLPAWAVAQERKWAEAAGPAPEIRYDTRPGVAFTGAREPDAIGELSPNAMPSGTVFTNNYDYATAWIAPELERIALAERAGDITPEQANAFRAFAIQRVLNGDFGPVDATTALRLRGDLRELTSTATAGGVAGGLLENVGLRERAGEITPEQANAERKTILEGILGGKYGAITETERLQAKGDLRQLLNENTEATAALASEMKALRESVDTQNRINESTLGIGLREAQRALGDLISGQIGGFGVGPRGQTAGSGVGVRYAPSVI